MNAENIFILDTDLIDDAERAARTLHDIVPRIEQLAHRERRDATEHAVTELHTAVIGLTALLRQITDGLLTPGASFAEINSRHP